MLKEALRPGHDEPPVQESACYQRGQGQGERAPAALPPHRHGLDSLWSGAPILHRESGTRCRLRQTLGRHQRGSPTFGKRTDRGTVWATPLGRRRGRLLGRLPVYRSTDACKKDL